jgi:hypothetical protein
MHVIEPSVECSDALVSPTVDIDVACAVTDQAIRCFQKIVHAYAESNLLHDLPCLSQSQ